MVLEKRGVLKKKSYAFALRVVKLHQYLKTRKEEIISKQVLRSGTSIGAHVHEAEFGQSKADFISKLSIRLKEANETSYSLNLLKDSNLISETEFSSIHADALN